MLCELLHQGAICALNTQMKGILAAEGCSELNSDCVAIPD